jgi:hypothetical protein
MFIGEKLAEVQAQLDQMGLGANMVPDASPAPDASKVGTAYFVNPTGNVRKNDTITVRFYGAMPATPSQPEPLTAGTNVANVVTVTIPPYKGCPAGSTLLNFTVTATPSTFTPTNPVGPKVTSLTWTLAPTPAGSTTAPKNTMSYVAQCSGAASPSSETLGRPPAPSRRPPSRDALH